MANSSDHTTRVADSLLQIEIELRRIDAWESEPPSPEALQSAQPFAVDTLEFTQWLQFVFVSRMKVLIEGGQPASGVRYGTDGGRALPGQGRVRGRPD